MDYKELATFLTENEIPRIKRKPKTFLGIAKQPHYENVLSNIYAFFFDVNEVHKLRDLFVKSLLQLIDDNEQLIDGFYDFEVLTEFAVSQQKRIDILLKNSEQAIIIENKVYHHLNNDLEVYYNDVVATTKLGVVLSLKDIAHISHPNFVNITHVQLLKRVIQNLGDYILNANDKYMVFLKDFYQNILNLSIGIMNEKDFQFYKSHRDKIHQTVRFLNRFKEYIKQEVERACHLLNGEDSFLTLKGTGPHYRYFISKKVPNLMLTVVFGELYQDDKKRIYMVVELKGQALQDSHKYNKIDFCTEEQSVIIDNFFTKNHSGWAHFAGQGYYLENDEFSLENLAEFIVEKMEEDKLLSIFRKLENFLIKTV